MVIAIISNACPVTFKLVPANTVTSSGYPIAAAKDVFLWILPRKGAMASKAYNGSWCNNGAFSCFRASA